jgi:hypothetical protein
MNTHGSLRSPYAVRCDHSSFATIIDVLILVQIWSIGVLEKIFNQRWDLPREAQHPVVQLGSRLLDELEYAAPQNTADRSDYGW